MTPLAALSIAPIAFCNLTTRLPLNDAYPSRQHASRGRIDFSSNNPFDGLTQHVLGRKRRLMNNAATRRGIIVFKSNEINEGDAEKKTQQTDNNDESLFFELMSPITSAKPDQMSASSLAYLGDVLFELFIRSRYVWPSRRMSDLQNTVVSIVRGKLFLIMCENSFWGAVWVREESLLVEGCEKYIINVAMKSSLINYWLQFIFKIIKFNLQLKHNLYC